MCGRLFRVRFPVRLISDSGLLQTTPLPLGQTTPDAEPLANDERFGIWGGLSERERRRLKKAAV